ncbi:MAG: hypothetical protein RBS17_02670 [Coriobacteriia bacterium]|nr:hypothetical protein [Coriobacteriia bacterium]
MRRFVLLLVTLLALSVLLAACAGEGESLPHPAVTAVTELLELRRDDVRDADAYAPYFEDIAMADALAGASDVPTGTPRVPPYGEPYLTAESTSTADIAVVWESDEGFPEWTLVTVFSAELVDGVWRIADAIETTITPGPIVPEGE